MTRRLFWVLIWLGLACATYARAAAFAGVDGAAIETPPPPGYCLLGPTDVRYARLRDDFGAEPSLKAIFGICLGDRVRPSLPDRAGYIAVMPQNPRFRASDLWRSEWLKHVRAPPATALNTVGVDRRDGAAFYYHVIRTPRDGGWGDTRIEATAVTVVKNTPVEITAVRMVASDDVSGGAAALDEARSLLRDMLRPFGKANGVDFDHVVTSAQSRGALSLAVAAFVDVAGAILMLTLAVRRLWVQAALAALLAVAGVLIYRAAPGAGTLLDKPLWDLGLWAAFAVLFVGLANGFWLVLNLARIRGAGLADRMRATLVTRRWPARPGGAETTAEFTKRWFVTVAAATGGVVFAMLGHDEFVGELLSAFGPSRIVFTVLATVVSITLIGPVEEFIFGSGFAAHKEHAGGHAEETSRFEQLLASMSPRAFGRFGLVMAFMLMLTVMHGAFEARVEDSKGEDITLMLVASVGPAIITYYWCAALQHGGVSVARRAGFAAALAGLLTLGIPNALVSVADAATLMAVPVSWMDAPQGYMAKVLLLVTAPVQMAFSVVSFALVAFGGGAVIDIALRRRMSPMATIALVGAVLIGLVLLFLAFLALIRLGQTPLIGPEEMDVATSAFLAVGGWLVGLVVSGFPTVLQSSTQRARPIVDDTAVAEPPRA